MNMEGIPMTRARFLLALIVAIAGSVVWLSRDALIAQEKPDRPPVIAKWEYKMMSGAQVEKFGGGKGIQDSNAINSRDQEEGLTKLGSAGWELVAVQNSGGLNFWYFLKRSKAGK
jgi:hypothetical protein